MRVTENSKDYAPIMKDHIKNIMSTIKKSKTEEDLKFYYTYLKKEVSIIVEACPSGAIG